MPTTSTFIARKLSPALGGLVSVSTAKAFCLASSATKASNLASVSTSSYASPVLVCIVGASSLTSVMLPNRPASPKGWYLGLTGDTARPPAAPADLSFGSASSRRASRPRKPSSVRWSRRASLLRPRKTHCSALKSKSTSVLSVTRLRATATLPPWAFTLSRSLGFLISSALRTTSSAVPNCLMSSTAVFSPTPGMPGTLSILSPIRLWISTACKGPYPSFSSSLTGSSVSSLCTSYMNVQSVSNWRRSLSLLTR